MTDTTDTLPQSEPEMQVFTVPDISCGHCVDAITSEVSGLDGVDAVNVDLETKLVTVMGGDRETVAAAIDRAGYDVVDN